MRAMLRLFRAHNLARRTDQPNSTPISAEEAFPDFLQPFFSAPRTYSEHLLCHPNGEVSP